ncbi:MAG: stage II sporulation protein M [Armatimonadota bacterium]
MDERAYIEQKKHSWERFSDALNKVRSGGVRSLTCDQLRSLGADYRAIISDLSFVRGQGASEGLILYLNELAARAHGVLYVPQSTRLAGAISFILRDFPRLFRATILYSLVAASIFAAGWAISAAVPEVRDTMIPGQITKPKPGEQSPISGVDPSLLSAFIMTNNINVGIIAFAGGITAGSYTVFELAKNGLVIGAVAAKAIPVLGGSRFWALILPHGIIELMAIFICGGAGLYLGASIIAPGDLRRRDSIRLAGATSLRLFAGAVILFVIAGIIEGFITPSALSDSIKLGFAALTAIGLILYLGFAGATAARKP